METDDLRELDICALCECSITAAEVEQTFSAHGRLTIWWRCHCGTTGTTSIDRDNYLAAMEEFEELLAEAQKEQQVATFSEALARVEPEHILAYWRKQDPQAVPREDEEGGLTVSTVTCEACGAEAQISAHPAYAYVCDAKCYSDYMAANALSGLYRPDDDGGDEDEDIWLN